MKHYVVVYEQTPSNWCAYVPDLAGCVATAATREPPRASNASSAAGERFQALTAHPALSRFAAIGAPIMPKPKKAIRFILTPEFILV